MINNKSKNLIVLLGLILILVTNLFLFIPFSIYLGNLNEFITPILIILKIYSIPALVLLLLFFFLGLLIRGEIYRRYLVLLAIVGLLIWIQSFVLIWEYGILDGRQINWSQDNWRGGLDLGLWIVFLIAAMVYYKSIEKMLFQVVSALFLVQTFLLIYTCIEKNDSLFDNNQFISSNESLQEIYKFSPKKNVLHLLLDGFQADVFEELIDHDSLGYRKNFSGFVFYKETLGTFPYTRFAVPAFLSGDIYNNDVPKNDFIESVLKDKTILNTAYDSGYEVDLVSEEYWAPLYALGKHTNSYVLRDNTKADPIQFHMDNAIKLFDLTLFRLSPHFFKKYIYNDQRWLIGSLISNEDFMRFRYFSHTFFINKLIKNMNVERKSLVYKYIHVMNTHNPMVVSKGCRYAGRTLPTTRLNLVIQSKCTLDTVNRLFDQMKKMGVYDNTLIIMHSDHGGWVPTNRFNKVRVGNGVIDMRAWIISLATPLLAIKPVNASGEMKKSSALVSLTDIPDTISSLMNWDQRFNGRSVFNVEPKELRERKFYFYSWQRDAWETDFTGTIQEFIINGSHHNTPWALGKQIQPPQM